MISLKSAADAASYGVHWDMDNLEEFDSMQFCMTNRIVVIGHINMAWVQVLGFSEGLKCLWIKYQTKSP